MTQASVYFIEDSATGAVKIGYATNVQKRLSGMQVGSGSELKVLGELKTPSQIKAAAIEKGLHRALRKHAIRGEWFAPCAMLGSILDTIHTSAMANNDYEGRHRSYPIAWAWDAQAFWDELASIQKECDADESETKGWRALAIEKEAENTHLNGMLEIAMTAIGIAHEAMSKITPNRVESYKHPQHFRHMCRLEFMSLRMSKLVDRVHENAPDEVWRNNA